MAKKSIIGGVIGAIADYFTGGMGGFTAAGLAAGGSVDKNEADDKRLERQMSFQDYMSSSAYQRSMMDMQRAGLNPMLAFSQGGASSPGGAFSPSENVASPGVSSALAASRNRAELENLEAMNDKIKSDVVLNQAMTDKVREDKVVSANTAKNLAVDNVLLSSEVPKATNKAAAESSFLGKFGAYLDRITESLGKFFPWRSGSGSGSSARGRAIRR